MSVDALKSIEPADRTHLALWVAAFLGVRVAHERVCDNHCSPMDMLACWHLERPKIALAIGPRGGGKSFLSAIHTHLASRFHPGHETRVLGGSRAQSQQVHRAIRDVVLGSGGLAGSDRDSVQRLLNEEVRYHNGSSVSILAASETSVRGPHVPSLKLDEVDEIDSGLRDDAMGMCMEKRGMSASVVLTSTWHRVGGPVAGLIERARGGDFPLHIFCIFDVLERCPEERSGPELENCPECPLVSYCHDHRGPKAKRSNGHYKIDALIQKLSIMSQRSFEADFLCNGPRVDGTWFPTFTVSRHVSESAEYDPALPVHVSIDVGNHSSAVFFQVDKRGPVESHAVTVFDSMYSCGDHAEVFGRAVLERARERCNGRMDHVSTDIAGGAKNMIGPTVIAEYERVGLKIDRRWLYRRVADSLALLESFVAPMVGPPAFSVHPRATDMIGAMLCYKRAKHKGQWLDAPEDPQHPYEELIDALRGGLGLVYPHGRREEPKTELKAVPVQFATY